MRNNILKSIPVLSIFVLLGIMSYAIISPINLVNILSLGLGDSDGEAYAADTTSNTSSLIIDNGTASDSTSTVRNSVTYSSHTVKVYASNITGYTLSITGPANLTNGSTTITGAGGKTGTELASADMGWGYGWNTATTDNASMTYNSFTGSAQTLETSSSATSADFTKKLVFAAKFNQSSTEGHYRANVTLNLTVEPRTVVNWSVNYNVNGGSGGPSSTSGTADGTSYTYTIPTTTPTKSGYKLDGYSDNNSTTVKYQPGDTITLTSTSSSVTLYAIWKLAEFPSTLTTMQGMTASICDSVAIGTEKSLTDTRGNTSYTVRKLTDGNCWMVDNLKLNLSSYSLTTSNSDVTTNKSTGWATNVTSASNWSSSSSDNKAQFNMDGFGNFYYDSYGYYYSWYAATAGTGTYSMSSGDATGSICPKGWKLPKGGSSGDFQALYNAYHDDQPSAYKPVLLGASTETAGGAYFPITGYVSNVGLQGTGYSAIYWSRTTFDNDYAKVLYLYLYSQQIHTDTGMYKYLGGSVRCVAYSS